MGMSVRDEDAASGNVQLAWWKPGMAKHAVVARQNPEDGNFSSWITEELRRAPEGMIFFFITTTTDIF